MTEPFNTQVPNIIDDMGLDPFERALYVHYKRVCGNNPGGYSNETVDTIRKKLKMSAGQVSEARKSLAERGLILMQDTRPVVVTIVDIWNLNKTYYQLERQQRPDIEGWTVEQLHLWLSDFHSVKLSSHNDSNLSSPNETISTINEDTVNLVSPSEQNNPDIHTVKLEGNYVDLVSQGETKKDGVHDKALPTFEILYNRWLDNNLGKLGPRQVELFGDYYDEHPDWVSEIIDTTIGGKPGNPWQYFVKIINSWVKNGKPPLPPPKQESPARYGAGRNGRESIPPTRPLDQDKQATYDELIAAARQEE